MATIKRFTFALAITVLASFATALAQAPQFSTVNLIPDEQKVRVSAVGDVLDMRVAVSDESGDIVFESGAVTGDHSDWTMMDPRGRQCCRNRFAGYNPRFGSYITLWEPSS